MTKTAVSTSPPYDCEAMMIVSLVLARIFSIALRKKENPNTSILGHSRRVTDLTLKLAGAMGLKDSELVNIKRGVLLHDIGKPYVQKVDEDGTLHFYGHERAGAQA